MTLPEDPSGHAGGQRRETFVDDLGPAPKVLWTDGDFWAELRGGGERGCPRFPVARVKGANRGQVV